jgi:hypothetical protein
LFESNSQANWPAAIMRGKNLHLQMVKDKQGTSGKITTAKVWQMNNNKMLRIRNT